MSRKLSMTQGKFNKTILNFSARTVWRFLWRFFGTISVLTYDTTQPVGSPTQYSVGLVSDVPYLASAFPGNFIFAIGGDCVLFLMFPKKNFSKSHQSESSLF
jgi:hypothetical protein